jgi:2-oxoglutarate dehydrogenase E2 component (dihydrolipoamide succinyltransferase)
MRVSSRALSVVVEPLESLGDSITTAVIVSWNKKAGDAVNEDDVIAVVETDKVTMDIRAKKAGVFVEALVSAQAEITVGAPLYKLDTAASAAPVAAAATPVVPAATAAPVSVPVPVAATTATAAAEVVVPVPVMGESITTGVLASWVVKEGDAVGADQVLASLETDKVNVEVRAPHAGTVTKLFAKEGEEVTVGNPLFSIVAGPAAAPVAVSPVVVAAAAAAAPVKAAAAPVAAAPAAAKKEEKKSTPAAAAPVTAVSAGDRSETRVKMTRMRQRIAARLKESQNTAAMLTTFQEVDMTNIINVRNLYKEDFEKVHGVKLGFMSAFVKAASSALMEIPAVNAVIDESTNDVVYRNYVDISVAVASPAGLVVPVLRNCEKMNFAVRLPH